MRRKVLEKRKKERNSPSMCCSRTNWHVFFQSSIPCFISPRRRVDHHALCKTPSSFLWHRRWRPPPTMVRDPTPKNGCCWINWTPVFFYFLVLGISLVYFTSVSLFNIYAYPLSFFFFFLFFFPHPLFNYLGPSTKVEKLK